MKIVCPVHGIFHQSPEKHLFGQGCPECKTERVNATKRANGTFASSRLEDELYELLLEHFEENDIKRQYIDKERYPFHCDFYIESRELFIELNGYWTHGPHWYDSNSEEDNERLELWKSRIIKGDHSVYDDAIDTWTRRDPLKRKTAEENNLNYLVFWDNNLTDAKEWLVSLNNTDNEQ